MAAESKPSPLRKKPLVAQEAPTGIAVQSDRPSTCCAASAFRPATSGRRWTVPFKPCRQHERESADPEPEHAEAVDHEVHRHGVRRILRPAQARLHEREAGLHEHDEEPGDQRPDEVDRVDAVGRRLRHRVDSHCEDPFVVALSRIGLRVAGDRIGGRRRLESARLVRYRIWKAPPTRRPDRRQTRGPP